jgi:hypothetical protein
VENIYPVVIEDLGYMPPGTENALKHIAELVHSNSVAEMSMGKMPPVVPYGHRLHSLAEKVGLANQIGNARLALRYLRECTHRVIEL